MKSKIRKMSKRTVPCELHYCTVKEMDYVSICQSERGSITYHMKMLLYWWDFILYLRTWVELIF